MGASLVLDILLVFLWKSILRIFWLVRTSEWARNNAIVTCAHLSIPDWGCPVVKLSYKLVTHDEHQEGTSEIPFFFMGSAKQCARMFSDANPVIVRVDLANSQRTRFFCIDQKS